MAIVHCRCKLRVPSATLYSPRGLRPIARAPRLLFKACGRTPGFPDLHHVGRNLELAAGDAMPAKTGLVPSTLGPKSEVHGSRHGRWIGVPNSNFQRYQSSNGHGPLYILASGHDSRKFPPYRINYLETGPRIAFPSDYRQK